MTVESAQSNPQAGAGTHDRPSAPPAEPPASDTRGDNAPADADDQDTELNEQDDQDDDPGRQRNREAQYRRRAQAAEAERDQLRGQLDALHRQIVGNVARVHGLDDVGLLEYRGHELSSFIGDDGTVDIDRILEATAETIKHCNIAPQRRPVEPNPQQGAHGTPVTGSGLANTINKALGR